MTRRLLPFFLVVTIFVSLFSIKLIPLAIISCCILWIFNYKEFSLMKTRINYLIPYILYILVFLAAFIASENKKESIKELERLSPFAIFPLIVFCSNITRSEILKFKRFFVLGTVSLMLLSIFLLINFALKNQEFLTKMDDTYLQWKMPHLLGYHPSYFGLIIVLATQILLFEKRLFRAFWINIFLVLCSTLFLFYLSPRVAIITQFLLLFYYVFFIVDLKSVFRYSIILFGVLIVFLSIKETSFFSKKLKDSFQDERFLLWKPALKIIKSNFYILGEGLGDGEVIFKNYLVKNGDTRRNLKGSTDIHNQYLENYVTSGVFGLFALLLLFLSPLLSLKSRELLILSSIFFIAFTTESMLNIIKGITIFIIIFSMFTLNKVLEKEKKYD